MSMRLEGLAGYRAYLSVGPLEDKGSFGITSRVVVLFKFPIYSFWVVGLAEDCQNDSPWC